MKKEHILLLLTLIISIVHVKAQPGFEWANYVGGFCDIWGGPSSAIDSSGNIYNTGAFSGTLDFDPGPGVFNLSADGTSDIIIRKTDAEGDFVWAKAIGSSISDVRWYDKGKSIAIDDSGFVYVAGVFYGTVDFDPGVDEYYLTSNGKQDSFILKLSADGEFVWVRTIGGTLIDEVMSIALDHNGNLYATGQYEGSVDFDPGDGVFVLSTFGFGDTDIFILKLDSKGEFLWALSIGGFDTVGLTTGLDGGMSVTVDASANVYITGVFEGVADFDPGESIYNLSSHRIIDQDIFILKLDADANFIWARSFGGPSADIAHSIVVDEFENVHTTGKFYADPSYNDPADFDPGPGAYNLYSSYNDIFVHKLDAEGDFLWVRTMGDNGEDVGRAIAVDQYSNVYTTGEFSGTVDFNPGNGSCNLIAAYQDIYIQKLDANGNFLWAYSMGNINDEFGVSIIVDSSANIYTNGNFRGIVDFDPGQDIYNLDGEGVYSLKLSQCLLDLNLTNNGNTLIASAEGASYQWVDCNDGKTAIAGETNQSFTATANGNYAVIINNGTCFDTSACYAITIVGINESSLNSSIDIYPNPTKGMITIKGRDIQNVEIRGITGQLIMKITSKRKQFDIDLSNQAKGVYLINVITSKGVLVRKIVVE